MRPIGPNTQAQYARILARAFGDAEPPFVAPDLDDWTNNCRALLRAATRRAYLERGLDASEVDALIPARWEPSRTVEIPTEREVEAYTAAARELDAGKHAMVILPLALGLRANEVITLPRKAIERGAQQGELLVMRKGAKEQVLPAKHAVALFEELLSVPRFTRSDFGAPDLPNRARRWDFAGEVLASGNRESQYNALHKLVKATALHAGLDGMRPHKLRHGFATRMARDGAPLPVVQWMLGHAKIQTTLRYIHPSMEDAAKYVREF